MHVLGFRTFDSMDECCVFSVFSPLRPQGFGKCLGEETIFEAYEKLYIRHLKETATREELFVWNQTGQDTGNPWHLPLK